MRRVVALLSFSLLVMGTLSLTASMSESSEAGLGSRDDVMYKISSPITIASNMDFSTYANGGGNGSAGNPWILEDYEIDGNEYTYCIYITNTTDHFVVRNCFLYKSGYSVYYESVLLVEKVQNGKIINNSIMNNFYGIHLESTERTTIDNNTVRNNTMGISLHHSNNNTIVNNTASFNKYGFILSPSNNNTLAFNIASYNSNGIYLGGSSNNTVTDNIASSNFDSGITIDHLSIGNSIKTNYARDNGQGICLYRTESNTIACNNVSLNHDGILLDVSNGNLLVNNSVWNNTNGISLKWSRGNKIDGNDVFWNTYEGIRTEGSGDNIIMNNRAYGNRRSGIFIDRSSYNNSIMSNIAFNNKEEGILIDWSSRDNIIMNNTIFSNEKNGILVDWCSSNNILINNMISSNEEDGIRLEWSSSNNIIKNNTAVLNRNGIFVESSDNNPIINNTVSSNYEDGINVQSSVDCNISGNMISDNWRGVYIDHRSSIIANNTAFSNTYGICIDSSYCTIIDNNASSNEGAGILLTSNENNIINNTASWNLEYGIHISRCSDNRIIDNILSGNAIGMFLEHSNKNLITNNTVSMNRRVGIHLDSSSNNILAGNTMVHDGIGINGGSMEQWDTNIIDTSNSVNGKPVYCLQDMISGTAPSGAGQIIIVNCMNIKVEDQNISDASAGIQVGFSNNITIIKNNLSRNAMGGIILFSSNNNLVADNVVSCNGGSLDPVTSYYGINLEYSHYNMIVANDISSNNDVGVQVFRSDFNTISNNIITRNTRFGLYIWFSGNNTIIQNTVSWNNEYGIGLGPFSNDNIIYHNSFFNNTVHAYDEGLNSWDNGYPTGGNYWSDYTGIDLYHTAMQNEQPSDGFGDTSYMGINGTAQAQDNYPLIRPWSADMDWPVAEAGPDCFVDMGEIVTFNGYGSKDDVGIVSYTWSFFDGGIVALDAFRPSYRFDNAGVFLVILNVTDADGKWDTDPMLVTVNDTMAPLASAGPDISIDMGAMVVFDAFASKDNVGVVNFTWAFNDDKIVMLYGMYALYEFNNAGSFNVILKVTDGAGNYGTDMMLITVNDTEAPIANAGPDRVVERGRTYPFNGSGSSDNVRIANYTWKFYEGNELTILYGERVEHMFMVSGDYNVSLIVKDTVGNTAWDCILVTVEDNKELDDDGRSLTDHWWIALVFVMILISIGIGFFVLKKRDRNDEE